MRYNINERQEMKDGKDDSIEITSVCGGAYGIIRLLMAVCGRFVCAPCLFAAAPCMLGTGLAFRAADKNIEPNGEHGQE